MYKRLYLRVGIKITTIKYLMVAKKIKSDK